RPLPRASCPPPPSGQRSFGGIAKGSVGGGAVARTGHRKTTHRFGRASPHPAHGRGEPSLGRSADPRRAAEARNRRLGRTVSRYLAKIELAVTRSQPPAAVCLSLLSKRVANGLGQQLQRRLPVVWNECVDVDQMSDSPSSAFSNSCDDHWSGSVAAFICDSSTDSGTLPVAISPAPAASNIRTTSRGLSACGPPSSTMMFR